MRIAEIFESKQGEGLLAGTASLFVRASGCNLRCWFCDTPYASWEPEGGDMSVQDIAGRVLASDLRHVVITGGEPMLFSELIPLCDQIQAAARHITIETAGTLLLPVACDLMSISPKLGNSAPPATTPGSWRQRHNRTREAPEVVRQLMRTHPYQLKFVVDQPADCEEIESYLSRFPEIASDRVLLMPQGTTQAELITRHEWLAPYCQRRGYRLCPRKQIEWYGCTRGT